jgi:hypothetical protein
MPQQHTALLADLRRLAQQIGDENGKAESQPVESQTSSSESPATKEDAGGLTEIKVAGLVIGVDRNNPMKLEQIEVTPEPDGRVRVTISAKKE